MVLESPFYGARRPVQDSNRLLRVSDLLVLGRVTIEESLCLLNWSHRQGYGKLGEGPFILSLADPPGLPECADSSGKEVGRAGVARKSSQDWKHVFCRTMKSRDDKHDSCGIQADLFPDPQYVVLVVLLYGQGSTRRMPYSDHE